MASILPFRRRHDDHADHGADPATVVLHDQHHDAVPLEYDTGRRVHWARLALWSAGPIVAAFGFAAPHLFAVGALLLIIQATNRYGLRDVHPAAKFTFATGLILAVAITTEPLIGQRLADAIVGAWNGATGNT